MIDFNDIGSNIISGIISGLLVTVITIVMTYFKKLPPKIKIAKKLSYNKGIYKIKFLNEIDHPISIISSTFILSYRKDARNQQNNNFRYKLPIPGESIPYIHSKKDDEISGQRNEKTYDTLVINAQLIDQRTIDNNNVSKNIQEIYKKYRERASEALINTNEKRNNDPPRSLSIKDFIEEDESLSIIVIIEAKNLDNQITKTHSWTFKKKDIVELPYCKGRSLDFSEYED